MCDIMHHNKAFSSNNLYADVTNDSELQIYSIPDNSLKSSYIPKDHLGSTITCITWKFDPRRRSNVADKQTNLHNSGQSKIILGTKNGCCLLINSLTNEIEHKFEGHSSEVTDVCWHSEKESTIFYSCSKDRSIIERDHKFPKQYMHKFNNKGEVYTVRMGPSGKTLISGGKKIKIWDLKSKSLIKMFNGHVNPVIDLVSLVFVSASQQNLVESFKKFYFVSAAKDEKNIRIWHTNEKNSLLSMIPSDAPTSFDCVSCDTNQFNFRLLCVTEENDVNVFEELLSNSRANSSPLMPFKVIKISNEQGQPIPIKAAKFVNANKICLAYGKQSAFHVVNLEDESYINDTDIVVILEDLRDIKVIQKTNNSKVKQPAQNGVVHTRLPSQTNYNYQMSKRNRTNSIGHSERTLEEKLKTTATEREVSNIKNEGASMYKLLKNGLTSGDKDILNQVLQRKKENIIKATVSQVELKHVKPLIKELTKRIQGSHPEKALITCKWLQYTMHFHLSYLTTNPEIRNILGPVQSQFAAYTQHLSQFQALEGKLKAVLVKRENEQKFVKNEKDDERPELFPDHEYEDSEDYMDADSENDSD